jgi:hypothetical protein
VARVIAGMTMSLDGFVEDANGSAGALYPDFGELQDSPYMNAAFVTDGVLAAVAQATAAAGERAVTVIGGADLTRQLLAADLVDGPAPRDGARGTMSRCRGGSSSRRVSRVPHRAARTTSGLLSPR